MANPLESLKLFFVLLGALPKGRRIEQHDVFFGVAGNIKDLIPEMEEFWPEAVGKLHLDAYREVNQVGNYSVRVFPRSEKLTSDYRLFFINLGGYKPGEFEEYHYKCLMVAKSKAEAIKEAKETAFYKHTGFEGAVSHIDDKYGIDVDDVFEIEDVLSPQILEKYQLFLEYNPAHTNDEMHIGYFKLDKL